MGKVGAIENLWEWLLTALFGVLGVLYSDQKRAIQKLEDQMKDHEATFSAYRENSASRFVTREEVKNEFAELKDLLHRLNDKLDRKADR